MVAIRQKNKLIQQTKLAISVSLHRVVKQFLNVDFSVWIQNRYRYRCPKLSAWLSSNIFCTTIIQQNISILSRECKCYLLRHLCIKCFKTSNSQSASLKSLTVQLSANKVFVELTSPGLPFVSCSPSDSRHFFPTSLLSGVIVVGSCLLFRYSTASQCTSSSTLVLLTAFWMKLYSSATFLILQPQGLQTCSDKFLFLVNCNPAEPQQSAKISLAHLTLPDGENKFSNEARPPPEAKLSPQNLSMLFFFLTFTFGFHPLLHRLADVLH